MNLEGRNMTYLEKYQEENPSKYLSKGIRVSRFREKKKQIKNRILYAILLSKDIKQSELSKEIVVSKKTINDWITKGSIPHEANMDKLCAYLNYPQHILFNEQLLKRSPIICIPHQSKYYKRIVAISPAKNNILHGLLIVHNISLQHLAAWLAIQPSTLRNYIHAKKVPEATVLQKISDFFRIPASILIYDVLGDE